MRTTHIWAGVLLVLASVWCLFWVIPDNTYPPDSELDLAPSLVPSIAIGACLVLATVMAVQALFGGRRVEAGEDHLDEEFGEDATGASGPVLLNLLIWSAVACASWFLIEHVGFEPAMTLFLVATMLFVGARNPLTIALVSLATPIVLSQAAYQFFNTELPAFWR